MQSQPLRLLPPGGHPRVALDIFNDDGPVFPDSGPDRAAAFRLIVHNNAQVLQEFSSPGLRYGTHGAVEGRHADPNQLETALRHRLFTAALESQEKKSTVPLEA